MILRKPYAFFIRIFKPMHLVLAIITGYLIYFENRIYRFLTNYIYSSSSDVKDIHNILIDKNIYIIPIITIVLSLIILGVMFRKKKPLTFYVFNIFSYIAVIVINLYTDNFIETLESTVVSISIVKLIHDLVLINIGIETVNLVMFIIRGLGVNFKKFDFQSEISKFNISESDREEFEVQLNINLDERRKRNRGRLRNLKYNYLENRFLINTIIVILFLSIIGGVVYHIISSGKKNVEGITYQVGTFNINVDSTYLLDTDYKGNKITDNYLVVVNAKMNSIYSSNSLYLKDFSLKIGEGIFKPTLKYSNYLVDIGSVYNNDVLISNFNNYLFVFEIPEKFTASDMIFNYTNLGNSFDIVLNPINIKPSNINLSKKMGEDISFKDTLGDITFKINSYEISDSYLKEYNYCVKDECLSSKEYIKPSIDKNFDKTILRMNIEYSNNSVLNINSFYDLLSSFGSIYYKIGDTWYIQNGGFESIRSDKVKEKNISYIGVNSKISEASEIKLVFNIRGSSYEYILVGEI